VSDAVYPYNKGGKETRLHEVTTRLAQFEGVEVHIYTMKWWDGPRTVHRDGVWLHAISRLYPLYEGDRRSTRQALLFGLATLRLLFEPFDVIDVDHIPFFPLFSAGLVCIMRRKPLVATWHEVWGRDYWSTYMGPTGLLGYMTERVAFHLPHLIVSDSSHTTSRLRRYAPGVPVVTIPLGVDVQHIGAVPSGRRRSDVVFAGRLLRNKNIALLLDAIALIQTSRPDITCLVIGEGPERAALESKTVDLRLTANVDFMDFTPERDGLVALLKASRVFALPSEREGFGLIALEANACGLPVVTVRHPDNAARDLIVEGRNGYLVDLDAASLAAGILRALDADPSQTPLCPAPDWLLEYDWAHVADRVGLVLTSIGARARFAPTPPVSGRAPAA